MATPNPDAIFLYYYYTTYDIDFFSPISTISSHIILVQTKRFDYIYCNDIAILVQFQIIFQFTKTINEINKTTLTMTMTMIEK